MEKDCLRFNNGVEIKHHTSVELMQMILYNIERKQPQKNNPTALSSVTSMTRDEIDSKFKSWHVREVIDYDNGIAYLLDGDYFDGRILSNKLRDKRWEKEKSSRLAS